MRLLSCCFSHGAETGARIFLFCSACRLTCTVIPGEDQMKSTSTLKTRLLAAAALAPGNRTRLCRSHAPPFGACSSPETDTNPLFVKMKKAHEAKGPKLRVDLKSYAGKVDWRPREARSPRSRPASRWRRRHPDHRIRQHSSIVSAVQQCARTRASVTRSTTPLDRSTPPMPLRNDNFLAVELIGRWPAATLATRPQNARIPMLDLAVSQPFRRRCCATRASSTCASARRQGSGQMW